MEDSEARGLVLKRVYDLRNELRTITPEDFEDLPLEQERELPNVVAQLAEQKLLEWMPTKSGDYFIVKRITAAGIDVVEGKQQLPSLIHYDSSTHIHGSQNVQVGQGNVMNSGTIGQLNQAIEDANATQNEKSQAKGLLAQIADSKIIQLAFKTVFGITLAP